MRDLTVQPQPPFVPQPLLAPIVRGIVHALFRWLGGLTVIGAENLPAAGPVLICPNHLSDCDPLAVFAAVPRRDVYFIAKQELFDIPVIGPGMRAFGTIPIHRQSADRAAIKRAVEVLVQGSVLVVFPEGGISRDGSLKRLLPGAALMALRAQAEIERVGGKPLAVVPVGLARTNRFLPYGAPMLKRSRLAARMVFGRPIVLDSASEFQTGGKATERLIGAIETRIRRLTGQERLS